MKKNCYIQPRMDTLVFSIPLMLDSISLQKTEEEEVNDEDEILSKSRRQEDNSSSWNGELW